VRQIALGILSVPVESREAEYQSARQKFRDAGKSYGIDDSVMDRFVEGNISALRYAVEEIEQRGRIGVAAL